MGKFLGIDWRKAAKIAAPIAQTYDPTGTLTRVLNRLGQTKKIDASTARDVAKESGNSAIQLGTEVALGGLSVASPYLEELAHSRFKSSEYAKRSQQARDRVNEEYAKIEGDLEKKRAKLENEMEHTRQYSSALDRRLAEVSGNLYLPGDLHRTRVRY